MIDNSLPAAGPHIRGCLLAVAMLTGGCAAEPIPPLAQSIVTPPAGDLQLVEARQAPERHLGAPVRWGGSVVTVSRDAAGSVQVEVLERRLDGGGRPLEGSPSDGRFVIRATPDVDPDLYQRGNEITVYGVLDGAVEITVGNQVQRLPVVRVDEFVQWQPRWRDYPGYPPYDPWYYGPRWHFGIGISNLHHGHRRHFGHRGRHGRRFGRHRW